MARVFSERETAKPRVLVVDDSAFMRRLISQLVEASGEFVVIGTARNGLEALHQLDALRPDIITLDVDMPELDGLSTLERIMRLHPLPVVMLSAGTTSTGQEATLRALELGAVDFVLKPSGSISLDLGRVSERILVALRNAAGANVTASGGSQSSGSAVHSIGAEPSARATHVVVIAASTGGPRALAAIVPHLPGSLPAAVLVVQHMPVGFTKSLARRLNAMSAVRIDEAEHGEPLVHGRVYLAPGGMHMTVHRDGTGASIALDGDTAPVWGVRPAADLLFRSAADVFGAASIGVVLTGMGRDGADGARCIRDAGGRVVVQDRESATIFGMPQVAMQLAGADRVVNLASASAAITELLEGLQHVP